MPGCDRGSERLRRWAGGELDFPAVFMNRQMPRFAKRLLDVRWRICHPEGGDPRPGAGVHDGLRDAALSAARRDAWWALTP